MIVHGFYSYLILLFSLVSVYISIKLFLKANGNTKLPTVGLFFLFNYIIFIYIGATLMNFYIPLVDFKQEHYEFLWMSLDRLDGFHKDAYLLERPDFLLKTWLLSTSVLYLVPIGMLFFNKLLNKNIESLNTVEYQLSNEKVLFTFISVFFALALVALYMYSMKIEKFPIIAVIEGYPRDMISFFRSESGNNFNGKYHWYNLFMRIIPILLMLTAMLALYFKKNWKWWLMTSLLIIYNIFVAVMDTSKAPIVFLLLQVFILWIIIQKKINYKVLASLAVITFISLFFMYYFFFKLEFAPFNIIFSIFHRLFIGQITPFYWWQMYQENFGFINGASLPNPRHIFPFEYIQISVEVMKYTHPELVKIGVVGSMPTAFFADWWINFGIFVSLLSMFILGFIMQIFEQLLISAMNHKFSVYLLSLYIYGILFFSHYAMSSYVGLLVDEKIVIPAIIFYGFYKLQNRRVQ